MWLIRIAKEIWGPAPEWRRDYIYPWQRIIGVDGAELHGHVMRRTINGTREYRALTPDECLARVGADVM